jgi:3-oxoadipate enol-lactonase
MPTAHNGQVKLHWEEAGAGPPVLLIMGHRYSSAMWYPVMDALSAGHRVIRYDNRGTGQSDTGRNFSIGDLADDALAVLDAAGVDRAHIYGVSMGGGIAQELARAYPERVRSLILGCTVIQSPEKPRTSAALRLLYFAPPWVLRAVMGRRGHGYGSAAPDDLVAKDQAMAEADRFDVTGVHAQAAAIARYNISREQVSALSMPALVLHGDEDQLVPYAFGEELAATLPNSRLVTLQGAGHNYFIARGPEANAAALAFLAEQPA